MAPYLLLLSLTLPIQSPPMPQSEPQAGQAVSQTIANLSADLARLNELLRSLATTTPPQWPTSVSPPHVSGTLLEPYAAKSKPSDDAPTAFQAKAGETVFLTLRSGDWYLARTEDNRVGWVPASLLPQAGKLVESTLKYVLAQLQELKQKYENSPIRITGFSVDIGTSLGVTIQFEFR